MTKLSKIRHSEIKSSVANIVIESLKGYASIQDLGRPGSQHLGFSASGAVDEFAFRAANLLLGNPATHAAIELVFAQITISTDTSCQFVVTGADCQGQINSTNSQQPIMPWHIYVLKPGQTLTIQQAKQGLINYLAFTGIIQSQSLFNSQAQTLAEQKLGLLSAELKAASILTLKQKQQLSQEAVPSQQHTVSAKQQALAAKFSQLAQNFYHLEPQQPLTLRFMPAPLWHQLSQHEQQVICQQMLSIAADSNRMGYRLNGLTIASSMIKPEQSPLSKPVCYGTIQLPCEQQAIVLMKERQTIGGYPVLGTVMQTDLFRLSQMRPGQNVKLQPISVVQAQQQLSAFYQKFI